MSVRRLSIVAALLLSFAGGVTASAALGAAPAASSSASSAKTKHPPRRGGRVRVAWPAKHGTDRPKKPLTRWLARQVGARKARCPAPKGSKVQCASHPVSRSASVARATSVQGPTATIAATSTKDPLQLVRSFQIPTDDPAYVRTLNFSWTYDSAVAAAGFIAAGDQAQSERLLDQLAALQRTDGSIDSAFDVSSGGGSGQFTSGTIAWVGLADVTHDRTFSSTRYDTSARLAADYLLKLQLDNGLIRGGPTVEWASTLHNLVAYAFIGELGDLLTARGDSAGAAYTAAAKRIAAGIDANLIVRDADGVHFTQGLGDTAKALDVQALGAVYLLGRGARDDAVAVRAYAQKYFAVTDRSITTSKDAGSYNMTYAAKGPFSGYRPFADDGAPDILWSEGTNEVRLAMSALGEDTAALDGAITAWNGVTSGDGSAPLQADRTDNTGFGEFHVWPAAAPAAWALLSRAAPSFFYAPGASPAVTAWTKVRGGNMFTVLPDGEVDMLAPNGGERKVMATGSTTADATVTVDATLNYGSGWGVYLRTTLDPKTTYITGYCVQVDQEGGQSILVRQIMNDKELSVPLAKVVPGGSLVKRHRVVAHIAGNTLAVSYDGKLVLTIPDLAAASAVAAKASGAVMSYTPPTSGQIGLRAWNASQVLFHQVTITAG